ncbi:hypothetical protein FALBO_506 [Fusarium albosuccineum]|uniref:Uncharacterized protein n=1 Tax=Fusarium albosuccineum TaxID=1237068 RepID=A0A8H4LRC2_9HYPO|nr:hypothetical protein FALBO_506 [Fusarium albosuccineum]
MKFSLFSAVAMAASVMAAPLVDGVTKNLPVKVPAAVPELPALPALPVSKVARSYEVVESTKKTVTSYKSVDIKNTATIVKVLTVTVSEVKTKTSAIKVVLTKVKANKITNAVAVTEVVELLTSIHLKLVTVVGQLTGVVGLHITASDVTAILNLVVGLVKEILSIVEQIVACLGLEGAIKAIVGALIHIIQSLILVLIGLIGDLIPGVINILCPILTSFDGSVLGSILTPVAGILKGLTV